MHELALMSRMLEKIEKIKLQQNWGKVSKVKLVLGVLSGVDRVAIETSFQVLTQEWPESPIIEIEVEPFSFTCKSCSSKNNLYEYKLQCPSCQSDEGEIQGGKSLYFSQMEGE